MSSKIEFYRLTNSETGRVERDWHLIADGAGDRRVLQHSVGMRRGMIGIAPWEKTFSIEEFHGSDAPQEAKQALAALLLD